MASSLLKEIEVGALDPGSDLPSVLRKCITLGGATGSARLRDWASRELKGYGPDDQIPAYRKLGAPLLLDGTTARSIIRGQTVPMNMIPDFARDRMKDDIPFPQGVAQLADLVTGARSKGENAILMSPPWASELTALINHELAKSDRSMFGSSIQGLPPSQAVERVYWSVSVSLIIGILDVVRTTLVELVAEMHAGTPRGADLPSQDIAEQAVDIAINGKRNRVVINQVAPHGRGAAAASGVSSTDGEAPESRPRRLMWWIVGLAGIVAAGAAVALLFIG